MTVIKNTEKSTPRPKLPDILEEVKRDIGMAINCVQIGIIDSFDADTQSCSIKLALKRVTAVDPNGVKTIEERPVILQCPVIFLFGGNDFISLPIQAGDNCIVFFNDREIDNWFVNGGMQVPTTRRIHDISDAFALVGIKNLQTAIVDYLENGIRLSHDHGNSKIDLTDDQIHSLALLFLHTGNMQITGNLTIGGNTYGDGVGGGNINLYANILQQPGFEIHDGRGVSGTFNVVTVVDGIVVGGS